MLHASETWPLTKMNLQHNDRAIIRHICSIKPEEVATVRSSELLAKLELDDFDLILRERRLRWFGHVERFSGTIRTACDIQIDGRQGLGRLKLTWKKLTERDCHNNLTKTCMLNSFPSSGNFCHMLIIFAKILDPDKD